MKVKKIKAALSISRDSRGIINIRVDDKTSRITFVELEVSPENFANAVTGFSFQDCDGEVIGLEHIGKARVNEKRSVIYPKAEFDQRSMKRFIEENCQEEGWIVSSHLGSRCSIEKNEKGQWILNYSVCKYVEAEEQND